MTRLASPFPVCAPCVPTPTAAQRAFAVPHIFSRIISYLPPAYARGATMMTLNATAFELSAAAMYRKLNIDIFLHLLRGETSKIRLRQYFSCVRHIGLDLDDPLWRRLGMRDVYALFDDDLFPQLQRINWDMGNITKTTRPIPDRCLDSPDLGTPSVMTTYTTTYILHVFIGSIWPVDPLSILPAKWLSANYSVPACGAYEQHEKRIDLQLDCNWGDHSDTPEAWDYFKSRLTEVLRGPIVNLHVIAPSGQMLERIADVMADLHSTPTSRLPLQGLTLTFEHFQQMHLLTSRRVLEALKACTPELKVVIQQEVGKNIERFDDLASILIYAEHITHLELQMPFDLLDQPRTTGREVDMDNMHPLEDIVFPEYHGSMTRKRLSLASGIRRITFSARGRGSVYYDRVQAALLTMPTLGESAMGDLDDLAPSSSSSRRYSFYETDTDLSDDSDCNSSDLELDCRADAECSSKKDIHPLTQRRLSARSVSSTNSARAGPSRSTVPHEHTDTLIATISGFAPCTAHDLEAPILLSEEEAEAAETAEFQRAAYNLRAIAAIFAVLGASDVLVDIAPIDNRHESEYNLPSTFKEYPLEHWFEGTEYVSEGEMAMDFVERFVLREVGLVKEWMV